MQQVSISKAESKAVIFSSCLQNIHRNTLDSASFLQDLTVGLAWLLLNWREKTGTIQGPSQVSRKVFWHEQIMWNLMQQSQLPMNAVRIRNTPNHSLKDKRFVWLWRYHLFDVDYKKEGIKRQIWNRGVSESKIKQFPLKLLKQQDRSRSVGSG